MQYISYIMEHCGAGTLYSLLKYKCLASKLEAGVTIPGRGFAFFTLKVELTVDGWENLDTVITHVFHVRISVLLFKGNLIYTPFIVSNIFMVIGHFYFLIEISI